jgi:hypothetical protein
MNLRAGKSRCVEVLFGGDQVAVRDSKDRDGPGLVVTTHEWEAFIDRARDGEFDPPNDAPASKSEHSVDPPAGVLKQIDLLDIFRAGGTPVALAAVVGTGSMWFLVVAILYYRPVYDFLATILEALAERWACRIRPG